jgi:hypothetical protein
MEPVSAFAFAVNIIQLVDFGARVLGAANELYHSGSGNSAEHVELHDVAGSLSRLCDALPTAQLSPADNEIARISVSTKAVATELIAAIERLRVAHGPHKKWRSVRQALLTRWNQDKIESLRKRLTNLRAELSTQILGHIKYGSIQPPLNGAWIPSPSEVGVS